MYTFFILQLIIAVYKVCHHIYYYTFFTYLSIHSELLFKKMIYLKNFPLSTNILTEK